VTKGDRIVSLRTKGFGSASSWARTDPAPKITNVMKSAHNLTVYKSEGRAKNVSVEKLYRPSVVGCHTVLPKRILRGLFLALNAIGVCPCGLSFSSCF